ncbi:CENPT isoform 28, partial [Pan troglodytes]
MADDNPDSDSTPRTLLRRVLDTADPRTPRRPRSARAGARRALLETASSRRLSGQTRTIARGRSHGARSIGRSAHIQASGHLEEQTPRTLLKNILLTAPESSILMPESVVKPVPARQVVQPSRQESSCGRSLNLTFATPLQPQSVQRPGLARRPPARRAVDVGAFLRDLRDTSLAPPNIVLEDTQPFSQPMVGSPHVYHSLPCTPHTGAEDAEQAAGRKTQSSGPGLQKNSPGKPAQFLAGEAEEGDAFALGFLSTSSGVSGEDEVEPLHGGVEEAEK